MSLLNRLLPFLRPSHASKMTFQVDTQLIPPLQELAARKQLHPDEVANELLSNAIEQEATPETNLRRWHMLSQRQQEIAALTCLGFTNRKIAERLIISPETVKFHVRNILRKFNVHSKKELRELLSAWEFHVF